MGEMLRNRRLVDEESPHAQHARNLGESRRCTASPAANVIARSKVDDEIEASVLEWKRSKVPLDDHRRDRRGGHTLLGERDKMRVDVQTSERRRRQPLGQHWEGDAAATPHLEHATAARKAERTDEQRYFNSLLETISRLDVAEPRVLYIIRRGTRTNANRRSATPASSGGLVVGGRLGCESWRHSGISGVGENEKHQRNEERLFSNAENLSKWAHPADEFFLTGLGAADNVAV
jgi:hypothetical protein